jgi:hypothetical protein
VSWWGTDLGGAGKSLELKQKFNFKLKFNSKTIITVKTADLPKANVETQEFKLINHYYKYPGVVKWDAISVTVVDTFVPDDKSGFQDSMVDATRAAWELLKKSGYRPPKEDEAVGTNSGFADLTTPVKDFFRGRVFGGADGADGKVELVKIDHKGNDLDTWELYNPIITKIDWGSVEYGAIEPVEVTLTIDYDYAILR